MDIDFSNLFPGVLAALKGFVGIVVEVAWLPAIFWWLKKKLNGGF